MKNQGINSMEFSPNTEENIPVIDLVPQRHFLENLSVAAYSCDSTGKLVYYNDLAVELWGAKPKLLKDNWYSSWKMYKIDAVPMIMEHDPLINAIRSGKKVKKEELLLEKPDGKTHYLISCPKLFLDNSGKVIGGYNLLIDLSELSGAEITKSKKNSYKALSTRLRQKISLKSQSYLKNEERYQKMVEEVQDYAILLLDVDGTVLNWNRGAEKIKGYTEEEIIGRHFRIFYLDEDRENQLPEKLIKIATKEGKAMQEGWRKRKDGSKFWGFIVITALHDSNNRIIGFSKVTRDLTERKASEDQLKLYARNIEIKNKQLEEYAYVASHDLQEPLRKVQIFSELLKGSLEDKKTAEKHIDKINMAAKRMSALIKDVLRYSELSKPDELLSIINLNDTLESIREDHDLLIEEKQADVFIDPLPTLMGIPIQIQQLFSNLIGNALKFTIYKPVIEISYSKVSKNEDVNLEKFPINLNYHRISVSDNGPGFDEKYQEHVFKLFKRLDTEQKGTGIGLALCQKIVDNHKGFIKVLSKKNKGTTFHVYLPA